jgi:hypothetical protein
MELGKVKGNRADDIVRGLAVVIRIAVTDHIFAFDVISQPVTPGSDLYNSKQWPSVAYQN